MKRCKWCEREIERLDGWYHPDHSTGLGWYYCENWGKGDGDLQTFDGPEAEPMDDNEIIDKLFEKYL